MAVTTPELYNRPDAMRTHECVEELCLRGPEGTIRSGAARSTTRIFSLPERCRTSEIHPLARQGKLTNARKRTDQVLDSHNIPFDEETPRTLVSSVPQDGRPQTPVAVPGMAAGCLAHLADEELCNPST